MLKIGIIGAGTMGGMRADCYSEIPDAKVVAVAAYKSAGQNAPVKISDVRPK